MCDCEVDCHKFECFFNKPFIITNWPTHYTPHNYLKNNALKEEKLTKNCFQKYSSLLPCTVP